MYLAKNNCFLIIFWLPWQLHYMKDKIYNTFFVYNREKCNSY